MAPSNLAAAPPSLTGLKRSELSCVRPPPVDLDFLSGFRYTTAHGDDCGPRDYALCPMAKRPCHVPILPTAESAAAPAPSKPVERSLPEPPTSLAPVKQKAPTLETAPLMCGGLFEAESLSGGACITAAEADMFSMLCGPELSQLSSALA